MKMDAKVFLQQLEIIKQSAQTVATMAEMLETSIKAAIVAEISVPQGPVTGPGVGCPCPPNRRIGAATQGHPSRTICQACTKEHE